MSIETSAHGREEESHKGLYTALGTAAVLSAVALAIYMKNGRVAAEAASEIGSGAHESLPPAADLFDAMPWSKEVGNYYRAQGLSAHELHLDFMSGTRAAVGDLDLSGRGVTFPEPLTDDIPPIIRMTNADEPALVIEHGKPVTLAPGALSETVDRQPDWGNAPALYVVPGENVSLTTLAHFVTRPSLIPEMHELGVRTWGSDFLKSAPMFHYIPPRSLESFGLLRLTGLSEPFDRYP